MTRLLILVDPPESLDPATDTSLLLATEARRRGAEIDLMTIDQLGLDGGVALAAGTPVSEYDAVMVRKDPPFDAQYHLASLILERARRETLIVNDPRGLREANEKLFALEFPDLVPPTRVTRDIGELRTLLTAMGGEMIVKPLDGCGGSGVFHVREDDPNTRTILETAAARGPVMAQRYLPAAREEGDKRIFLLDGEVLGAVLRVARPGEARCNRCSGGTMQRTVLTVRERAIAAAVGERCRREGLALVGLDVIGGHLTEINVTSPTGLIELGRIEGRHPEREVLDWLEARIAARRPSLMAA